MSKASLCFTFETWSQPPSHQTVHVSFLCTKLVSGVAQHSLIEPLELLYHERPFGGNFDICTVPSLDSLTYLNVFKAVHSPFQACSIARLSSSCISGIQNPESYSLSSAAVDCFSRSSRVLEGRPGLRWLSNSASSSSWRLRYLLAVNTALSINSVIDGPLNKTMNLLHSNWACSCLRCSLEVGYPLH